jgi:hypothetical protein
MWLPVALRRGGVPRGALYETATGKLLREEVYEDLHATIVALGIIAMKAWWGDFVARTLFRILV